MPDELPPPKKLNPLTTTQQRIRIALGRKRYSLQVTTEVHELNEKPADILKFPDLPGDK